MNSNRAPMQTSSIPPITKATDSISLRHLRNYQRGWSRLRPVLAIMTWTLSWVQVKTLWRDMSRNYSLRKMSSISTLMRVIELGSIREAMVLRHSSQRMRIVTNSRNKLGSLHLLRCQSGNNGRSRKSHRWMIWLLYLSPRRRDWTQTHKIVDLCLWNQKPLRAAVSSTNLAETHPNTERDQTHQSSIIFKDGSQGMMVVCHRELSKIVLWPQTRKR